MKTIKEYQVEVLHGNSIDLEDALLKKDVLGLIDEWYKKSCSDDICRICGDCWKELKTRITG